MTPTNIILSIFTGLVALALVLQGIALLAISRKVRELSAKLDYLSTKLAEQADALTIKVESFLSIVKSTAEKVHVVQENVVAISKVVHDRVVSVDAFINEATDAGRLQMARFQDALDTTLHRIDETIDILQNAIILPVTEAQAIIRGIRSGLDVFFGRRRLSSSRSHHDEEMFI